MPAMDHRKTNALLELLYDREGSACGREELCRCCELRPAELEPALRELAARGHEMQSEPGGVRLLRPAGLDAVLIERGLGTRRVGRSVLRFEEVSSTSDVAWDALSAGPADGLVVLAEAQRAGRGRLGRRWLARPGSAVLMSVVLAEPACVLPAEAVTVAAGLGLAEAVRETAGLEAGLKWPNDVVLDGRKLAGILVEARRVRDAEALVVGAGLNVSDAPPEEKLDRPACCLAEHLGEPIERVELVRAILRRLDRWVHDIAAGRLDRLHEAFRQRCDIINTRQRIRHGDRELTGRVLDVDPLAGLVLLDDLGRHHHLPAATSTLR